MYFLCHIKYIYLKHAFWNNIINTWRDYHNIYIAISTDNKLLTDFGSFPGYISET